MELEQLRGWIGMDDYVENALELAKVGGQIMEIDGKFFLLMPLSADEAAHALAAGVPSCSSTS